MTISLAIWGRGVPISQGPHISPTPVLLNLMMCVFSYFVRAAERVREVEQQLVERERVRVQELQQEYRRYCVDTHYNKFNDKFFSLDG